MLKYFLGKLLLTIQRFSIAKRIFFFMRDDPIYYEFNVGKWTYGKPKVFSWKEGTYLKIGKFCSIAEGVIILLGGEHRTDWISTYPFNQVFKEAKGFSGHPTSRGDVEIGNDVWIGRDVLIRSGVKIGDGAVIGARSVVVHDVMPYTIMAGNPARLIREQFNPEQINALQRILWWDWPLDDIFKALPLLLSPDIQAFIDRYDCKSKDD